MIIGVPTETKPDETARRPNACGSRRLRSSRAFGNRPARGGNRQRLSDRDYRAAGARIVESAAAVWARASMVLKVKEPQACRISAPAPPGLSCSPICISLRIAALARELIKRRVAALGYETVQLEDRSLPVLRRR